MRTSCTDIAKTVKEKSSYGSLESFIRALRDNRPLDLNAPTWRKLHPHLSHDDWKILAKKCLQVGLHCSQSSVDLQSEVLDRKERDGLIIESVGFNTTPWHRQEGYFIRPASASEPLPAIIAMHCWGGPMIFGKDRIVNSGKDHPLLSEFRKSAYGDTYLAEELAKSGFAVLVIDAYHFGNRAPRGLGSIPNFYDPYALSIPEALAIHQRSVEQLYLGVRELMWAGTTWMGVIFNDDQRCIDYLQSRPEVDGTRIGCTGLSVGAWRANILSALDERISASVSVGWMSTGDHQQVYNLNGSIGPFGLLPGVWSRIDLPDLPVMSAPCASMIVVGEEDHLFPQEGVREAIAHIQNGYDWAGSSNRFRYLHPRKQHVYDRDIQRDAIAWFHRWMSR